MTTIHRQASGPAAPWSARARPRRSLDLVVADRGRSARRSRPRPPGWPSGLPGAGGGRPASYDGADPERLHRSTWWASIGIADPPRDGLARGRRGLPPTPASGRAGHRRPPGDGDARSPGSSGSPRPGSTSLTGADVAAGVDAEALADAPGLRADPAGAEGRHRARPAGAGARWSR